jgi:ATP-dependent DNA helicase RecQ
MFNLALTLLRTMLGPQADFRRNQWEAIEALAVQHRRALVVERTGWGKSIVYFLATKLLRETGGGPTLLISPLLSLMRNQLLMARKIGIRAATIHSGNRDEWEAVENALAHNACDILLVSPERLSNPRFANGLLPSIQGRIGMFVVDEAHCISDWGHDFRPDYRRIGRMLDLFPRGVPILATTATANDRVTLDVRSQLGNDLLVIRGPLARTTLRLQNLVIPDQAVRLAWLAENLPRFRGSGIVYCLTVADTQRVAAWLTSKGIDARPYHGTQDNVEREALEHALLGNKLKALVATVALGMGFDKSDLTFVIHYQRPGSVVAYYQQVGRAGRGAEKAYGILLGGDEDDDIINYFIDSAFPRADVAFDILKLLGQSGNVGMSTNEILASLNIGRASLETALKTLEIDGAISIDASTGRQRFVCTSKPWKPDLDRVRGVTLQRRQELEQMREYVAYGGCLMDFLARALDDPEAKPCGVCANCQGRGFKPEADQALIAEAISFLKYEELLIEPRKMWPGGLFPDAKPTIPPAHRTEAGRALSCYGDPGWGKDVKAGKYAGTAFGEQLVQAAEELIHQRWKPAPFPTWVTAIPSFRHPRLVCNFAETLAARLGLPFVPALICSKRMPEQKTLNNSAMQARNAKEMLGAKRELVRPGPVLLVDDIIDSGWMFAVAGWLLRSNGSGIVYPFALARSSTGNR